MILPRFGLTKRLKLPALYVWNNEFALWEYPAHALKTRHLSIIGKTEEEIILAYKSNILNLTPFHANILFIEWPLWDEYYLPPFSLKGKTVLDVGAGCGETALFFLEHRAEKVICIEPEAKAFSLLRQNIESNGWQDKIVAINQHFSLKHLSIPHDFMKFDTDGAESLLIDYGGQLQPSVVELDPNYLGESFRRRFPGWRERRVKYLRLPPLAIFDNQKQAIT